jgi:hypothetical protein
VVAECLARPILVERLVAGPTAVAGVSSVPIIQRCGLAVT